MVLEVHFKPLALRMVGQSFAAQRGVVPPANGIPRLHGIASQQFEYRILPIFGQNRHHATVMVDMCYYAFQLPLLHRYKVHAGRTLPATTSIAPCPSERYGESYSVKARCARRGFPRLGYLSKKPAAVKRLYVCGDGVEEGPALNMSKSVPKDAMARFARAGLVPANAFAGTEISWVGLGGGIEAAHVNSVKEFWTDYFAKTGAKVVTMQRLRL